MPAGANLQPARSDAHIRVRMRDNVRVKMTPMLRQYLELKEEAGDALLLYRMGDFYELFFEDAQKAAPILEIALTHRRHNSDVEAPMCGVPYHALDGYLGKLLQHGFRVAIAEQVEDPAKAKGLVRREIIRMHTPGTISDTDLLDGSEHCYLAAIGGDPEHPALAWIEVSTGSFEGLSCPDPATLTEHLARLRPREILVAEGRDEWRQAWPPELALPTMTPVASGEFSPAAGEQRLKRVLGVASLRGFELAPGEPLIGTAGALLAYVEMTQRGSLSHVSAFIRRSASDGLILDRSTLRNLEVERAADGSKRGSLIATLDHTLSRMGARRLHDWLLRPSVDMDTIQSRHRAVAEFIDDPELLTRTRAALDGLPDLERLAGRAGLGVVTPRDMEALRAGLDRLPEIRAALQPAACPLLRRMAEALDPLEDLDTLLHERIADAPPSIVGTGVIRTGWDHELDEQRQLARGGKELLAGIEVSERERTGIASLKVRYNKVFGYYIEVSRSNLDRVPETYERRQTLTNAERFITPELKELESKILSAEERAANRERELYGETVERLQKEASRITATAGVVAEVDVLAGFADRAIKRDYCRPMMEESRRIVIHDGRHPVLEELQRDPPFIPNDVIIDPDEHGIILLTGPNMGGKSTYLRQAALIVLMAHAGSFVPAGTATIGLTDRIFTRVGASDMLARGESTFMVEMTETANILRYSTPHSLVILDEVGRGTATFDGLSLAWSIIEYLHDRPEHAARVLFATHYHELTDLARQLPRVTNRSMAVKEWEGSILFLHRVVDGPSDRSYGIHVARLAGVPEEVCTRAEDILNNLERNELTFLGENRPAGPHVAPAERIEQLDLFPSPAEEISRALDRVDINRITPLEALELLAHLKEQLNDEPA